MELTISRVDLAEIRDDIVRHLQSLPSAIDSFLEDHILASNHYRIAVNNEYAGFASIHGGKLITQFALVDAVKSSGQAIFACLKQMEAVQSAFVPTCDEFYLAHVLDDYRQLHKQAYFFATPDPWSCRDLAGAHTLRRATEADAAFIRAETGDFFDPLEKYLDADALVLTQRNHETVGFGIATRSALYPDVASIGMFTIERHRGSGAGTATIALLIEQCRRRGIRPVAGCWYENHLSKKTLEHAGMFSATRLLKIDV